MNERNEKAKRILDNSTKIVAVFGILAILFAIWFSLQFAKSKTKKEFDNRQTYFNSIHQYFNKEWAQNAYWDSIGTEVSVYKYQHNEIEDFIELRIRKEIFNDQFNVQTNSTARPDIYKVLNASIERKFNTDTVKRANLVTLCMNALVLHKMTVGVQHTWGITHKSYFNNKSVITMKYDSYLDKQGTGDKVFPKDVLFEDQLPIVLRTIKLNDSTEFNVNILESQLTNGIGNLIVFKAKVDVQANSSNANLMEVAVQLDSSRKNVYYIEKNYPNKLIAFELNGKRYDLVK